jgi:N-acetyl-anhydromuramyl-L-alanine amidase AmpD
MVAALPREAFARDHGKPRDPSTIIAIVVHSVGGPACIADIVHVRPIPKRNDDAEFWQRILKAAPSAEAHYVIGRTGSKAQVMPVTEIANHTVGINAISIGLVHRGDGKEPFEEPQIQTLIDIIKEIRRQFPKISLANIVQHSDIDQRTCPCGGTTYRRRQDPGANFPMQRVSDEVRLPKDEEVGITTLPRLEGSAPKKACAVYQR